MAEKEAKEAEEYESDLDEAPLPAVRRRAAASDDEEEDGGRQPPARKAGSDGDSDGQGAAEVYDDEEEVYEEEEEVYEEYEEVYKGCEVGGRGGGEGEVVVEAAAAAAAEEGNKGEGEEATAAGEEEGKKGTEPYAVPTVGAFYMHDDRFQENGGRGRQRRMIGWRKLWNPKDERAWVHDRFDEMNLHDSQHHNERRRPRGRFRGRGGGRTRGVDRGCVKGNRSRTYYHDGGKNYNNVPEESRTYYDDAESYKNVSKESRSNYDDSKNYNSVPKESRAYYDDAKNYNNLPKESHTYYDDAKSHNNAPKVVRGRGSRRYQPRWKSTSEISLVQNNKSQNLEEASSNASAGECTSQTSNMQRDHALPRKQTFASNLNSASPPFYPSGSSHQELPIIQRVDAQSGSASKAFSSSVHMKHSSLTPQSGPLLRGKVVVPSVGHGKLYIEDSLRTVTAKGSTSFPLHSSASPSNNPGQSSISRGQGRGLNIGRFPSDQLSATRQVARVSTHTQTPIVQQRSVQAPVQSAPRMPAQMFGLQFSGGNRMPSPPQPTSASLAEDGEAVSPPGSNKSKAPMPVVAKNGNQGTERASFLYGGAHVLGATGAMGLTLGDQGFPGTPALLPVMQFGGQHARGPGVPSIGMALPGYVAQQQQLGLSNSEMTWLPVLTGAAGALGASYCSPYIALDGSYYTRPSEQASSSVSARETSATTAPASLKPQQIPEVVNDELSQRQNKPRRYSEMNFGQ